MRGPSLNLKSQISHRVAGHQPGYVWTPVDFLDLGPRDAIDKGEIGQLKEIMKKSIEVGMMTFDHCLFDLYEAGEISAQELQVNADAKSDLMLRLKLHSPRFKREEMAGGIDAEADGLSMQGEAKPEPARPAAGPAPAPGAKAAPLTLSLEDEPRLTPRN